VALPRSWPVRLLSQGTAPVQYHGDSKPCFVKVLPAKAPWELEQSKGQGLGKEGEGFAAESLRNSVAAQVKQKRRSQQAGHSVARGLSLRGSFAGVCSTAVELEAAAELPLKEQERAGCPVEISPPTRSRNGVCQCPMHLRVGPSWGLHRGR